MTKQLTEEDREEFRKEIIRILTDPEVRERAEKLSKAMHKMTAEDWFREFTI